MAKLIAKERFFYGGRNVEVHEEFEAETQDVALLTDSVSPRARLLEKKPALDVEKSAAITPPVETAAPAAEMQSRSLLPEADGHPDAVGFKRRYNRRDMSAKD